MDDRVGLALMTALAQAVQGQELQYELYLAATIKKRWAWAEP